MTAKDLRAGDVMVKQGFFNGEYRIETIPDFIKGVGWFCDARNKNGQVSPFPLQLTRENGDWHPSVISIHRDGKQIYPAHTDADVSANSNREES